jgi:hypothetical protein
MKRMIAVLGVSCLAMILGVDDSIKSLIEMFQEGMTFDNNTEEQKYSILQFVV